MPKQTKKSAGPSEFRMRIHPDTKRERQVFQGILYERRAGWYEVDKATAYKAAEMRENELNPQASPAVFEVLTFEAARQVEQEEEQATKSRKGTVEEPVAPGARVAKRSKPLPDLSGPAKAARAR